MTEPKSKPDEVAAPEVDAPEVDAPEVDAPDETWIVGHDGERYTVADYFAKGL